MFKFPAYSGPPIPPSLNPLNPGHYGMLLNWIYFQPARLIHYLHQADPELYGVTGLPAIIRTLGVPAYRTLYVMPAVMVSVLLGVFWILFEAIGMVSVEVLASILGGIFLGGVIGGAALAVGFSLTFGVAEGVADGIAFGVAFSLTYGIAEGIAGSLLGGVASGMTFGVALGIALGVSGGVSGRIGGGVVEGVALGIGGGFMLGMAGGVTFGIALGVGLIIGASRIAMHLVEWPAAWLVSRDVERPFEQIKRHPALWDSQAVLPLTGTQKLLRACLDQDFDQGLDLAMRMAVNPFQRWAVQRALADYMADHQDPLRLLYHLAYTPDLDHYLMPPRTEHQFYVFPTRRIVLLGELGQLRVDGSGGVYQLSQHFVWRLTKRRRNLESTPVTRLSGMLYELLRHEADRHVPDDIREQRTAVRFSPMEKTTYEGVRSLPGGNEITDSFVAMAKFLEVDTITALGECCNLTEWVQAMTEEPVRAPVIEAIRMLGEISRDVEVEQKTTNVSQQYDILNKIGEALMEVTETVSADVLLPERSLLNRIIQQWQSIIATEQVRLGEATLRQISNSGRHSTRMIQDAEDGSSRTITPFRNPYIAGNPVAPPLFIRHSEVFSRIKEVLEAPTTTHVITITGAHRLGITSLLNNLGEAASPGNVLMYEDMAGAITFVESSSDLLLGLADKLYNTVRRTYPRSGLKEPDPAAFTTSAHARVQFKRLTMQVCDILAGRPLILALDNFGAIEQAVESGKVGREIYRFLLSTAQDPQIILVLAGSPMPDGKHADHLKPIHDHTEHIHLTPLPPDDAWTLITNPAPDFSLSYKPEAVKRIIAETEGHPYLIQHLCHELVDRLNETMVHRQEEREAVISLADVDAVLETGLLESCREISVGHQAGDAAGG